MRSAFPTVRRSSGEHPLVLGLGSGAVEWLEGTVRTLADAASNAPDDLARAARFAAGVDEFGPRRCVLVLPEERFAVGVHHLPGLGEDELRVVLARKAAQDLGTDERDALYAALPMGGNPDQPNGGGYCLWSIRRSEIHDLVHALRGESILVERVVAQRGGLLSCAQGLLGGDSVPFIVAAVEAERTFLGLAKGGQLLMQSTLPHRVDDGMASHAMGLVQELRNFGGFWRRSGRGEELAGLVAVGLESTFIDSLETAVRGALGGIEFVRADRQLDDLGPRESLLRASAARGAYDLDFSLRLPPSARKVAALSGGGVLAALLIAVTARGSWSAELEDSRAELVALRLFRGETLDAEERARADRRSRAVLDRELAELRALTRGGIPLEDLLEVSRNALDPSTRLLSIGAVQSERGCELRLSAETSADTAGSQVALAHARRGLERSGLFTEVALRPPDQLPAPGSNRPLQFTIEALLAAPSAPAAAPEPTP